MVGGIVKPRPPKPGMIIVELLTVIEELTALATLTTTAEVCKVADCPGCAPISAACATNVVVFPAIELTYSDVASDAVRLLAVAKFVAAATDIMMVSTDSNNVLGGVTMAVASDTAVAAANLAVDEASAGDNSEGALTNALTNGKDCNQLSVDCVAGDVLSANTKPSMAERMAARCETVDALADTPVGVD